MAELSCVEVPLVGGAAASAMRGRSSPMALRSGASERVRSSAAEAAARRAARHRSCGDTEHRAPRWRCATLFTAPSAATPPLPASSAAHPPHRYLILPTRAPSARLPSSPPRSPLPRAATALWRVAARGSAARRRPLRTTGRRRAPVGPASLPLLPPRPTRHRRGRHRLRSSPAPAPARSRHTHPARPTAEARR